VLATVVENCKNLDLFDVLVEAQEDIEWYIGMERSAYHFGGCVKYLLFSWKSKKKEEG
jgi:hypothetical protein